MFSRKKSKELDVENLNEVIILSKKILGILFTISIIALIFLSFNLLKQLNIFTIIKQLLVVISPVFIGIIIAWLFDPLVKFLQRKKFPRVLACILVYVLFLGFLTLLLFLMVPSFVSQIKDFVSTIPSILSEAKGFVSSTLNSFSSGIDMDLSSVKQQIFASLERVGTKLTTNLPNT